MPTWQERLQQAERAAEKGARQAGMKIEEMRQKAEPAIRDAVDKAKPMVEEQTKRGRAAVDAKLDARKARDEVRTNWFRTESGSVYTAGYPDQDSMQVGIQAAAEHGWRVETTATVPERRRMLGGLTAVVAKQAADRMLKPDRFLVTFRRAAGSKPPAADPAPSPPPEDGAGDAGAGPDA